MDLAQQQMAETGHLLVLEVLCHPDEHRALRRGLAEPATRPGQFGAHPVLERMPERGRAVAAEPVARLREKRIGLLGRAGPCLHERRGQRPGGEPGVLAADEQARRGAAVHECFATRVAGRHPVERGQRARAASRHDSADRLHQHFVDQGLECTHPAGRGLGPLDCHGERLVGLDEVAAPQIGQSEIVEEERLVRRGGSRPGQSHADQRRLHRLLVATEAGGGVRERGERARLAGAVADRSKEPCRLLGASVSRPEPRPEAIEMSEEEKCLGLAMVILPALGLGERGEGDLARPLGIGVVERGMRRLQDVFALERSGDRIASRNGTNLAVHRSCGRPRGSRLRVAWRSLTPADARSTDRGTGAAGRTKPVPTRSTAPSPPASVRRRRPDRRAASRAAPSPGRRA